jgi:CRP/FNR family transcriptional regulator, cyclic AMP receptor protein
MVNKNSTIRQKFEGPRASRAVSEALQSAKIAHCDKKASAWLAKNGSLKFFAIGQTLTIQGKHDASVFILLAGSVDVCTNGNLHRTRAAGDHIGEMAAIDLGQPRSATVTATEDTATIKLTEVKFRDFLEKFPIAATEVAKELARRLRQRDEYFRRVNEKPKVFIISASESKPVASGIQKALTKENVKAEVWWSDVFHGSDYTLPRLVETLNSCDFAVAIGDPIDKTKSRGKTYLSVRDNVLLEYGMAVSALGLERSYFLSPKSNKTTKKASDFEGLTFILYEKKIPFRPSHVSDAVSQIVERVKKFGPLHTSKPKNKI